MIWEYESYELIKADAKNKYGHLLYEYKTVETMKEIRFLQNIGMSLKQIKVYKEANTDERSCLLNIEHCLRKRLMTVSVF